MNQICILINLQHILLICVFIPHVHMKVADKCLLRNQPCHNQNDYQIVFTNDVDIFNEHVCLVFVH